MPYIIQAKGKQESMYYAGNQYSFRREIDSPEVWHAKTHKEAIARMERLRRDMAQSDHAIARYARTNFTFSVVEVE